MRNLNRPTVIALAVVVPGLWMTGCNKSSESADASSTPSAAANAATTQKNVNQIQSNPNIPPEAKARIISSMQGKGTAPAPPPGPPK